MGVFVDQWKWDALFFHAILYQSRCQYAPLKICHHLSINHILKHAKHQFTNHYQQQCCVCLYVDFSFFILRFQFVDWSIRYSLHFIHLNCNLITKPVIRLLDSNWWHFGEGEMCGFVESPSDIIINPLITHWMDENHESLMMILSGIVFNGRFFQRLIEIKYWKS